MAKAPYSHRHDPDVPAFADEHPVVFMDGECALCSYSARLISRMDKSGDIKICPVQSPLGQAILVHYELDPKDPDTWIYLENGIAYESMDAVIRLGTRLGGIGHIPRLLSPLPRSWRNTLYKLMARNRYRLFGRNNLCDLPDKNLRDRIIQ